MIADIAGGTAPADDRLESGIADARRRLDETRGKNELHEADLRWAISVLMRRLTSYRSEDVCRELDRVLDIVETHRHQLPNPHDRFALMSRFPHLHDVLCEHQFRIERIADAFRTIERSKGRFLSDYLHRGEALPAIELDEVLRFFPAGVAAPTSYLTALVGDSDVFLVLVTSTGRVHHEVVPIRELIGGDGRRADLEALVGRAQHKKWSVKRLYLGDSTSDSLALLAPLVNWLDPTALGEHLVFCPDGPLHNVPLHLLPFGGGRLDDAVGVSCVHGIQSLRRTLEAPPSRPGRYVAFVAPSVDDYESAERGEKDRSKLEAIHASTRALEKTFGARGQVFRDERATLDEFEACGDLPEHVVHFATHGLPPRSPNGPPTGTPTATALDRAALALASSSGLPRTVDFSDVSYAGRLTPRRLLDMGTDMVGGHVTTMCCVSGIAEEGAGGDALGLDWAFLLRGAASVLSTYWDIDAVHASPFVTRFYRGWFGGMTRAEALSAAARESADDRGYHGFCLTGDWR